MFTTGKQVEIKPAFDSFGDEIDNLGRCVAYIIEYLGWDTYRVRLKGTDEEWDLWQGRLRI